MIRKDFEKGGFPLCETSPVICVDDKWELHVVYNRYDLINVLKTYNCVCYGVWPGKMNTDIFTLDSKVYATLPVPPEKFKDIDNAESILVSTSKDGGFSKISYIPQDGSVMVEAQDKILFEYIKKIGLRYTTVFE